MKLKVTAYRKIRPVDCVFNRDGLPIDPITREALNDVVLFRIGCYLTELAAGINEDFAYFYEEKFDAARISHTSYADWIDTLAEIAGYQEADTEGRRFAESAYVSESGPFWELINFSHCEGVIGAEASTKIAKDFADFREKALAYKFRGDAVTDAVTEWFRFFYLEFEKAFQLAADGGAVKIS